MPWYNPSWLYRQPITVDNTANATSALAYYQVGISLTGAAYTSINAHAKADRSDIRVTDSDGVTLLNFALEGNDTVNSAVYLLVKVPRVAAAASSTIYVYYGNAAATSVSSYAVTVGPATAIVGPTDIYNQTDRTGFNANPVSVLLKNQGGIHGGGAGLNGKILCWIMAGAGSNNDRSNGDILMLSSTDGGVTFPVKTTLVAHDATHCSEPRSVVELADGTLLIAYNTDTNTNENGGHSKLYIGKSTDGGATWTNLALFPTPVNPVTVPWTYGVDGGASYGRFVEKSPGGDLYLPAYAAITGDTGWHQWLLKCPAGSDPVNGSNWVVQGTIAFNNVDQFAEGSVIQTTDSSHYLAVMRVDTVGDLMACTSADSGVTWTTPTRINLPATTPISGYGCAFSPDLIRLASGNLLCAFGMRYGTAWGIGAVISTDGGATWIDRPPMDIGTGANVSLWDTGYPTAVQNASGTICMIFYYPVGAVTTDNIGRIIVTEDYVCNCNNLYDGCESFGALWASVGANATLDAAHVNHGAKAVKIDNSAATGGINDFAVNQAWSANPAQATPRVALSHWRYETTNDSNCALQFLDATDSITGPTHVRVQCIVLGTNSLHLEWYNGTTYQDTGVPLLLNRWNKLTVSANVGSSSVTGALAVNNAVATTGLGMYTAGAAPKYVRFLGASVGSTHNVIDWLDDVYTHQYTANIPVVTAGVEQVFTGGFAPIGGGLVGGSLVHGGLVI